MMALRTNLDLAIIMGFDQCKQKTADAMFNSNTSLTYLELQLGFDIGSGPVSVVCGECMHAAGAACMLNQGLDSQSTRIAPQPLVMLPTFALARTIISDTNAELPKC